MLHLLGLTVGDLLYRSELWAISYFWGSVSRMGGLLVVCTYDLPWR